MKVSPLVVLLIGLAIGGFAFGSCQASRASDAEKSLQNALAAHRDSLAQWHIERSALSLAADSLRQALGPLQQAYKVARILGQRGRDSVAKLLALLPDSRRATIGPVIAALGAEGEACRALEANCEARAQNAEARVHGDSLQLTQTVLLLQKTEAMWHTEQRKNAPGFLGLRSFWNARRWTLPLTVVTGLLLLTHR